jgi:hypothetical protein
LHIKRYSTRWYQFYIDIEFFIEYADARQLQAEG